MNAWLIVLCHFVLFFFRPLCCVSFFELQILIIPLVSSNFSYCCLVEVIVVNMFYLFSLDILLSMMTVKTINLSVNKFKLH